MKQSFYISNLNGLRFLAAFSVIIGHCELTKKELGLKNLLDSNIGFFELEKIWPKIKNIDPVTKEQILIESSYTGYIDKQKNEIEDFKKEEGLKIPKIINYKKVGSLSNEVVEKLTLIKPPTLGAASRIPGITPAAIIAILRHLKKTKNKKAA